MEKIDLTIDGQRVSCSPGTTLLEAALAHGIRIPTLCFHPELDGYGACRLCLVEDEQTGRLMASCVMPAASGMVIRTENRRILAHRRNIIRLMLAEHPESCVVCNKGNRCRLREQAARLGVGRQTLYRMPHPRSLEQANPFIIRDLSKCILCGLCIRADHELVAVGAIDYHQRGFPSRPETLRGRPLEASECTFCGTCVAICPTGALSVKDAGYVGTPHAERETVCGFCGVGCALSAGVAYGRVVEINPGPAAGTVNGATLCARGHFAHDYLLARDRLVQPLIHENGTLKPASWQRAIEYTARRLQEIKTHYGPQSLGFYGSSKCSNEENYLFQKIARTLLQTNNVDHGGSFSTRPFLARLEALTGGGNRPNPIESLRAAEAVMVVGADVSQTNPVVAYTLKRLAGQGHPLLVVHPHATELSRWACLTLCPLPGSEGSLLEGLALLISRSDQWDAAYAETYAEGLAEFREALERVDLAEICRSTGVGGKSLEEAARILAGRTTAFVLGSFLQGEGTAEAVLNLALLTGGLALPGGGMTCESRENNQSGAWDMGSVPDALPGRQPLQDRQARKHWEHRWRTRLSPDPGFDGLGMILAAEQKRLKGLYIMGENPLRALPQPERVRQALLGLELLVVQDIVDTETAKLAHVVLPGAPCLEKAGSFTNLEGRIQRFEAAAPPPGLARADWEILDHLAAALGGVRYGALRPIRLEIARCLPLYSALADAAKEVWVKHDSPYACFRADGRGQRMRFCLPRAKVDPSHDQAYPFSLIQAPSRFHLGSGTRTGRSRRLCALGHATRVEACFEDLERLGIPAGARVRLISESGCLESILEPGEGIPAGCLVLIPGTGQASSAGLQALASIENWEFAAAGGCRVRVEYPLS